MAKLLKVEQEEGLSPDMWKSPDWSFMCPGCNCDHGVWTTARNAHNSVWGFNNDVDKPTFTPSLLIRGGNASGDYVCHSFINNGMIQFLSDCTHKLAGQTVEIPDVETYQID